MSAETQITLIVTELGKIFEPTAIAFDPDDLIWSIALDNKTVIELTLDSRDDAEPMLVFALPLGGVPKSAYGLLLRYNLLWTDTGGVYMAMSDDGAAVMLYRRPIRNLDAKAIHVILEAMIKNGALWRQMLENADFGEGEGTTLPVDLRGGNMLV